MLMRFGMKVWRRNCPREMKSTKGGYLTYDNSL